VYRSSNNVPWSFDVGVQHELSSFIGLFAVYVSKFSTLRLGERFGRRVAFSKAICYYIIITPCIVIKHGLKSD
jgi:hypothetical protein